MESSVNLCCLLSKAVTLDPVPVIGDMVYVPGAEGFKLSNLIEGETVDTCPAHRFTFKGTLALLLQCASKNEPCTCQSSPSSPYSVQVGEGSGELNVSPYVHDATKRVHGTKIVGGGRGGRSATVSRFATTTRTLWAYEMDSVVMAYKWLIQYRSRMYSRCCNAMIVYQLKKSLSLPPGLYVYRNPPSHFGCTAERPSVVVDQFNHSCDGERLPTVITIDMFPGRENFSALYVIRRNLAIRAPEYGNRMFGEVKALGILSPRSTRSSETLEPHSLMVACEHHDVAVRTTQMCVIDLRWKGFDTKTACIKAIPRVRGLQALVWSNHTKSFQDIECKVLTWLFGHSNEIPKEVEMIDRTQESLGIRYMLIDMETFPQVLPEPPNRDASFFMHVRFEGDISMATRAIGEVPDIRSRMGSPRRDNFAFWYRLPATGHCKPTPFSCGIVHSSQAREITEEFQESLREWTERQEGTSCMELAVQYTLFYLAGDMKGTMMVSHTVMDKNNTLHMFQL